MTFADLVGKFIGSGNFIGSLAEQGAREVIDILPPIYLMRYAPAPADISSSAPEWKFNLDSGLNSHPGQGGPQTKRILKVLRNDGSQWRECSEVDYASFSQAANANSLYEATDNAPVFNIDSNLGYPILKIKPAISGSVDGADSGKAIYVPYPNFTSDVPSDVPGDYIDPYSETDVYYLLEGLGFSRDAANVMALKAAIYITQNLISDAVQDDEDNELLAMLNAQQASLNAQYEMDMKRLMGAAG